MTEPDYGEWVLQWYDGSVWKTPPPLNAPSKGYELSADRCWATVYAADRRTPTATWMRTRGADREFLAQRAEIRRVREAQRESADPSTRSA